MTALAEAAREVQTQGSFHYLERTMPTPDLNRLMQG
jgi:hypothetical protein